MLIKGKRDTLKTFFRLIALFVAILSLVACVSVWKDIYYQPQLPKSNTNHWRIDAYGDNRMDFIIGSDKIILKAPLAKLSRGGGVVIPVPIWEKDKSGNKNIRIIILVGNNISTIELDLSKFLLISPKRNSSLMPLHMVQYSRAEDKYINTKAIQKLYPVNITNYYYKFIIEYDLKVSETDTFYLECPVIIVGGVNYDMGKIYFKKKSKTDWDITGFGA